ncbi:MAG: hypothetical protein HON70_24005, partial [Lentisphaerae bacterium]|nr:hypothetical protein [Lentisphaerota bacterium]
QDKDGTSHVSRGSALALACKDRTSRGTALALVCHVCLHHTNPFFTFAVPMS